MQPSVRYTAHALSRRAQRSLSIDDVEFVMAHGREVHCAGALHVFLGGRDIPGEKAVARRYGRLEGTVLVLSTDDDDLTMITAYRNRRGFKAIRAKVVYDRRECRAAWELASVLHPSVAPE